MLYIFRRYRRPYTIWYKILPGSKASEYHEILDLWKIWKICNVKSKVYKSIMYTQYHLISINFISTKYLTFQNLRTISTGFGKIKDQKLETAFIIIRKFTTSYLKLTSYLRQKNIDFETMKLAYILGILIIFLLLLIFTKNIWKIKDRSRTTSTQKISRKKEQ